MVTNHDKIRVINLIDSVPQSLNTHNLLRNKVFVNWLIPTVKALRKVNSLSQEQIKPIATARLQKLFKTLSNESLFWRGYLNKYYTSNSLKDIDNILKNFPIISKKELGEWGEAVFINVNNKNEGVHTVTTSGTTGTPVVINFTDAEIIANVWPYFFLQDFYTDNLIRDFLARKFIFILGREVSPQYKSFAVHFPLDSFSHLSNSKIRKQIYRKIEEISPTILWAFSSVIYDLIKYEKKEDIFKNQKQLRELLFWTILSGESLSLEEFMFVCEELDSKVGQNYTSKEVGKIGSHCGKKVGQNAYHVHSERIWVEIIDDNGKLLPHGNKGNIIVTTLDRVTTPIIRYAIGDTGKLLAGVCECGKSTPLLIVFGRAHDNIIIPGGGVYSVLLFKSIFIKEFGLARINQYQIIQESISTLIIKVILSEELKSDEKKTLEIIFSKVFDNKIQVHIEEVNTIKKAKSGKNDVFISFYKTAT